MYKLYNTKMVIKDALLLINNDAILVTLISCFVFALVVDTNSGVNIVVFSLFYAML
jgi:hypothetical protein